MVMDYDRKGGAEFVKRRLQRLGIPIVIWALIMIPMNLFVFGVDPGNLGEVVNVGHLWFLQHLLVYSLVYALWRHMRKGRGSAEVTEGKTPGVLPIVAFALLLAAVSAVIRIWYPIDRWVSLAGIRVAFADVPRDLSFFVIGAVAYRRDWLRRFPTRAGLAWLGAGVVLAALWYAFALGLKHSLHLSREAMGIAYAVWESLLCCGMCIGLLVLFREKFDSAGRLLRSMATSQYAAYVFHVGIVVGLQALIASLAWPPFAKFALVTLAAVPITFWFSNWTRGAAWMRKVF